MPKDVYLHLLPKLETKGSGSAHFETSLPKGDFGWVLVAFDDETSVTFYYPYDEDPKELINKRGIPFPSGYNLSGWEGQNYAMFDGPRCPHLELADIIDTLFTKLQGAPTNYVVKGWIM